ncbi:MAG TPA: AraC family transcriptional regulator [Fimbriimonadaceae bacterium]|nr:AraC family transcriptional regulator [Fimbriimonadaceae bacterium]HRJ95106.1 AraC family transcriptional regulator [Fimbriimonadaceae bacterium]
MLALLEAAREAVERDLDRPLDLATLGREIGLSPYHLQRTFQRVFGSTPHALRRERRLLLAESLLESGLSIAEASARAGFASRSSFGRLFRQRFGLTPSQVGRRR